MHSAAREVSLRGDWNLFILAACYRSLILPDEIAAVPTTLEASLFKEYFYPYDPSSVVFLSFIPQNSCNILVPSKPIFPSTNRRTDACSANSSTRPTISP